MCGEKEKSNTKAVHCSYIILRTTLNLLEKTMQNLIFSIRRRWAFHLTSACHIVIGYSDAVSKEIQQIGEFSSVRGFR